MPDTKCMEIIIRKEQPGDEAAVRRVNLLAFDGAAEADIVDQLRLACPEALSLVALDGDQIVGHILFTPAVIGTPGNQVDGMGLAPMSVLPEYQGQGIGSQLARTGLEMLRQAGQPFVIVLGHPHYYAQAPQVTIVSPNGDETLQDQATIQWTGSDGDGDTLSYAVLYSPDNGASWETLAVNLAATSYTWNLAGLPPGSQYLVKVMATDGFNTGQGVSQATFTIRGGILYLPLTLRQ